MQITIFPILLLLTQTVSPYNPTNSPQFSRRALFKKNIASSAKVVTSFLAISSLTPPPALASTSQLKDYIDPNYSFKLSYPSSWVYTTQTLSDRRVLNLFVSPDIFGASAFVSYTPVRDDFTSLGSFGTVEQVGQSTILPKGDLANTGISSTLLSSTSKNDAYYFDYTVDVNGEVKHLRTVFTLVGKEGNAGKVIVTFTVQCNERDYGALKGNFDAIIDSYGKVKG